MPKSYEAETDHKPLGWGSKARGHKDVEVGILVKDLRANRVKIRKTFEACGVKLKGDDTTPLMYRLQFIIIKFVAECRAHPLRTARQLLPTLEEIRRDTPAFLQRMGEFSPEAVALVYQMYRRLFPDKRDLEVSECMKNPTLDPGDIAVAADAAIALLEQEANTQGRGRPRMRLVEELAVALGKQFRGLGGKLGRTYHRAGFERGAFLEFMEAVVGPARQLVALSGYSLTPETMVRHAQEALGPDKS